MKIRRICLVCDKEFEIHPSQLKYKGKGSCCSWECRKKYMSEIMRKITRDKGLTVSCKIAVDDGIIKVTVLKTGNVYLFDYDEELFKKLSSYSWSENRYGYLRTRFREDGKRRTLFAHHLVMPKLKSCEIDHINGDIRDNRRANLRYVTRSENNINRSYATDSISGIRGVCWDKQKKKWFAHIQKAGRNYFLGYHNDPLIAYMRRKEAEEKLYPSINKRGEIINVC